jgi:PRTRC genetic system protein F
MTALVLPRIDPQVPRTILPAPLLAFKAQVSRLLIEAEAFDESDLPPVGEDSLAACQQALDRWIKRQIGPLHCLQPRFGLSMVGSDGDQISDYFGLPMPQEPSAVVATWAEFDESEWVVGGSLTALNRQVSGLGVVVLHVLRHHSTRVYPLFTPELACDVASYLYWHGESDEEVALDINCGDDEEERAAMREQMVSKATIHAAYPEWARQWPSLEIGQCARLLRRAIKRLRDPEHKAIAADALALCALEVDDSFRPEAEGEFIGFGAVLSWTPGDVTCAIYDDLRSTAYEGENCAYMGEIEVPMDDPGKFSAWQQAMGSRFEAIRLIDRLIYRLAARD